MMISNTNNKTLSVSSYDFFLDSAEQLLSFEQLDRALLELSTSLNEDYADKQPIVIGIMNGALVTLGHLLPKLTIALRLDYLHATRYGNKTTGGEISWLVHPQNSLAGQSVLLVDDIFDEGITLKHIVEYCYQQGATDVKSAVLLNKQHDRKVNDFSVDYYAITVPDRYVFGFGLDYNGLYRNAPGIFAINK